ncbi:MAG: polyprenyl synthetase family protein [Candidatus Shapirobacteria bacterium]|nr:polyprenyl synthetase family protein [Candidatus Shapirobacteria bacterium]
MIKNDAVEILTRYKNILWPEIAKHLDLIKNYPVFCQIKPKYQSLLDLHFQMVSDYPQRKGKYLRPTLLMLTAQSLGVDLKNTIFTAESMQVSEDWILGHDDIEDQSDERRGQPALHKIYGNELALNAGDALHVLMWQILSQNNSILDKDIAQKIEDEFFIMLNRTILGQTIEIKWTQDNRFDLSEEDILLILESKTGYYTIAGPMRLGAILAGATDQQLESIYKFGILLGRSFQIIDDLLDLTSDFEGQKKQQGNDIYEGKRTIMLIHLLNNSSPEDLSKLKSILSKTRADKTADEITWVISKMTEYGSLDYSRTLAKKYASEAQEIFDQDLIFLNKEPFRSELQSIFDFILTRTH